MNFVEIENQTFAELKANRAKNLELLKSADHDELAARYLQARQDAKMRDEKLAEQGKLITELQKQR
jgi:hypothetical protein